ncbi:hypothetical protein SHXM_00071 [Streptomyces hygroscopicus]|nr:hypothetical protein SHXM_00071 [Streptomyces hygroscopicus]
MHLLAGACAWGTALGCAPNEVVCVAVTVATAVGSEWSGWENIFALFL